MPIFCGFLGVPDALITAWLEVRVLPGPPLPSLASRATAPASRTRFLEAKHAKAAAPWPKRAKAGRARYS